MDAPQPTPPAVGATAPLPGDDAAIAFMRRWLLLLLAEREVYGDELYDRMAAVGMRRQPGGMPRMVRSMERDGLVETFWVGPDRGPKRRRHRLTRAGWERLHHCIDRLEASTSRLH